MCRARFSVPSGVSRYDPLPGMLQAQAQPLEPRSDPVVGLLNSQIPKVGISKKRAASWSRSCVTFSRKLLQTRGNFLILFWRFNVYKIQYVVFDIDTLNLESLALV